MNRHDRFFHADLSAAEPGLTVDLDPLESGHAVRVKRKVVGGEIELFDGGGCVARAAVVEIGKRGLLRARIIALQSWDPFRPSLNVVTAVPRGNRMETMLDMLTQLNVTRITPVAFARSTSSGGSGRRMRWHRVAVEACKQCRRNHLPELDEPVAFDEWFKTRGRSLAGARWLADPDGDDDLGTGIAKSGEVPTAITVVIGPEGGLVADERASLLAADYRPVAAGANILRIEAAAVAVSVLAGRLLFSGRFVGDQRIFQEGDHVL